VPSCLLFRSLCAEVVEDVFVEEETTIIGAISWTKPVDILVQ